MESLVLIESPEGEVLISSQIISDGLEIHHKNLLENINEHLSIIEEEFGRVAFQTEPFETPGGVQMKKVAYLNEGQAMFIGTLSRNTKPVIQFKSRLVKSFQEYRNRLASSMVPTTLSGALRLAADQAERIELQESKIKLLQPKGEFYDAVVGSNDTVDIGTVAKVLNFKGIGRTKLFEILRDQKVLNDKNIPYQTYVDREWFRVVESKYSKPDGSQHVNFKTVVFQKGVEGIRKIVIKLKES